jgi:hypothetical protein
MGREEVLNVVLFCVAGLLGFEVHAYLSHTGGLWCGCW